MTSDSPSQPAGHADEQALRGFVASYASPVSLRAGSVELLFERETGWIRRIRVGNREVIRAIYGAVRDRNWRTVPPILRDVSIRRDTSESFEIGFIAECREEDVHFVWEGRITGNQKGIQFEFNGRAQSSFLRNRIGLCVLLPISGCVGETCWIEHSDGIQEQGSMPEFISPHQPFQDIRAFRQNLGGEGRLEVEFDGDVFEMEDQRNWTDASFKIYSTPLSRPFPVLVHAGESVRQNVALRLIREAASEPVAGTGAATLSTENSPCTVEVHFERLRPKPRLGLGVPSGQKVLRKDVTNRLQFLHLDHLRVDCRLWEAGWHERLKFADEQAQAIGAGLHIAFHLSENGAAELELLARAAGMLKAPVQMWLVFVRQNKCTPTAWVREARKILSPICRQACFAAGTDANFAELNRERCPVDADWFSYFSINPQVHASDNLTLIENLAAQTEVVKTARTFSTLPLVLSPITLLPRNNPDATGATPALEASPADPRQDSLFAAGWTLGSLAALTAAHPVYSLTYYETTGARGIMRAAEAAEVFPVYDIFAGLKELKDLAEVRFTDDRTALQLSALAGLTESGLPVLWLANLGNKPLPVQVKTNPRFRSARVQEIHEQNIQLCGIHPEAGWRKSAAALAGDPDIQVNLPAFGLARWEGMS